MRTGSLPTGRRGQLARILAVLLVCAGPAWADFGADVPLTAGDLSRITSHNNAWSVATDGKGNVHVIYGAFEIDWGHPEDQEFLPMYRMYDREAGTWGPPLELADVADRVVCWWHFAIATDCRDNVHMAWVQLGGMEESPKLYYRRRDASGSWQDRQVIYAPGGPGIEVPSVAADQNGNVFVCWAEGVANPGYGVLWNVRMRVCEGDSG